jgi:GNAT superfamily N-acetyltransferase
MRISTDDGKAHWDLRDPRWDWDKPPFKAKVLELNGEPIAALRLFKCILYSPTIRIMAIGVGGVFVMKKYRGLGYGQRLLTSVSESWPVLYCWNQSVYLKCGFVELRKTELGDALMVRPEYPIQFSPSPLWQCSSRF